MLIEGRGGMSTDNVLLLGATGVSGRNIARRLHDHGLALTLAARDRAHLDAMADSLPGSQVLAGDVLDPGPIPESVRLVVNTVGPFSTHAQPIRQACLDQSVPYLEIANEHAAAQQLLSLDSHARRRHIPMLTAVGMGPTVAEALLAEAITDTSQAPTDVRLITAPAGEVLSPGLQATFADAMARGAVWLEDGELRTAPFGSGMAEVRLGGRSRPVLPAPTADVIVAHRISNAHNVKGFFAAPGADAGSDSYVYVDARWSDGRHRGRQARLGNGNEVSADIVAETVMRMLAGDTAAIAGAWTPVGLFGPAVVFGVAAMEVTDAAPQQVWVKTGEAVT
jgi:Saccharopine dehydrogenase NADP binding domain